MKKTYWADYGEKREKQAKTAVVDCELIAKVLEGNPAAETEFYNAVYDMVKPVVFKRVPDKAAVEDVAQETVIAVYCKLDTLRDAEKFPGWVWKIAFNKAMDWRKKQEKQEEQELFLSGLRMTEEGEPSDIQIEDPNPAYKPEEVMINSETAKENKALVRRYLGILNPEQREIARMRCRDEMKFEKIAEKLDCNENTVKSRYRRAIAKMAKRAYELQEEESICIR